MTETTILGFTLKEWDSFLDGCMAEQAEKALDYLDGDQEEEIRKVLDCPHKGRRAWKSRGIIPRYRNITKPIITHSGMLFKDTAPTFTIYNAGSTIVNQEATNFLYEEFSKIEFTEFAISLDECTRLLKTTVILTQWDAINKELVNTLLHRGNSAVILDPTYRDILGVVYETSEEDDTYRIITKDMIYDYTEGDFEQFVLLGTQQNPFGIVPVTPFYDTNLPRCGFWLQPGMDLINTNEMYNLHLTDTEFALSWAKLPTLFTNCGFDTTGDQELEETHIYGQKLPTMMPTTSSILGGPSKVIQLDSAGVDNPFIEYKAPVFDVKSMDDVVNGWVHNIAQDWSVRIEVQGQGKANSGFQLVVEEMPNLELRKLRQKMFAMGFKRWYKVLRVILNTVYASEKLPVNSELFVEFQHPQLPIEAKEQEDIWTIKLDSGRASLVDYFVETKGMTEEEAMAKIDEINKYNSLGKEIEIIPPPV